MGEVVVKIPEDIHEVIEVDLSYNKIKEKLEEMVKEERAKIALKILREYKGTVKIEDVSEEDLHMQGD